MKEATLTFGKKEKDGYCAAIKKRLTHEVAVLLQRSENVEETFRGFTNKYSEDPELHKLSAVKKVEYLRMQEPQIDEAYVERDEVIHELEERRTELQEINYLLSQFKKAQESRDACKALGYIGLVVTLTVVAYTIQHS